MTPEQLKLEARKYLYEFGPQGYTTVLFDEAFQAHMRIFLAGHALAQGEIESLRAQLSVALEHVKSLADQTDSGEFEAEHEDEWDLDNVAEAYETAIFDSRKCLALIAELQAKEERS